MSNGATLYKRIANRQTLAQRWNDLSDSERASTTFKEWKQNSSKYDKKLALKLLQEYTGEDTEPSLREQAEHCISRLAVNDWTDTLQFFTEADLDLIKQGA